MIAMHQRQFSNVGGGVGGQMMIKNLTAPQGSSLNQAKKVKRVIKVAQNNNSLGSSNLLSAHLIASGDQIN